MKKLAAFDLDGTLTPSKSPLTNKMDGLLSELLRKIPVCIISGGHFAQFERQLLGNFSATEDEYANLHLMPTSGTHYLRYENNEWKTLYREVIPEKDRAVIVEVLHEAIEHFGFDRFEIYGEQIEDRKSQVTLSVFGQDIVEELGAKGVDIKTDWDPTKEKRYAIREFVQPKLPESVVAQVGGKSSVDIVMNGVDKGYGMKKIVDELNISPSDVIFVGDELNKGGNDYSVKAVGVDTIQIEDSEQAAIAIETILKLV